MRHFVHILLIIGLYSCNHSYSPLEEILSGSSSIVHQVIRNAEHHKVQIRYTQIDRDRSNQPKFTSYEYGVDSSKYFYPASTVKMPVAALAIEHINELSAILGNDQLTIHTPVIIDSLRPLQTKVIGDSTSANGHASVAHYAKKIFVVSDNDAYNRLFEIVGRAHINDKLQSKGYSETEIFHRLSIAGIDNRYTPSWRMMDNENIIYSQSEQKDSIRRPLVLNALIEGIGYIDSKGELINEPFDFSAKNRFSIRDMEAVLKSILFPTSVPESQRFDLTESDYQQLYQWMSILPLESQYPSYDYYDSYVKFFLFGDDQSPMPDHIRIFNKVGVAYGYLTDCAYVVDFKNKVEFMLTATLSVNENQIYNDGIYEYDDIGFPFMAELGEAVYEYELKRERAHIPDLSRFNVGPYE